MKKYYFFIAVMMLMFNSQLLVAKDNKPKAVIDPQTELRLQQIHTRVIEIRDMDKSDLNRTERKALRNELVSLKKEANAATSGGIYLSVGAIIIIILLLILIL